jgi:hypothetical protein
MISVTVNLIQIRCNVDFVCNGASHVVHVVLPDDTGSHAFDITDQITPCQRYGQRKHSF